jgi:tetratricopeptide (TPR) repeat protein
MKAQHRKELETNVLADRLGGLVQGMKEAPSRGTLLAGGLILLVVALVLVWRFVAHSAEERSSERWLRWQEAANAEELEALARENPDKPQARLARFQLARRSLYQGLRDLGSPLVRKEALDRVRAAAEDYEKLARDAGDTPALAREALLNAAKAYETLGDVGNARRLYEELAKADPQGAAAKQLARLDKSGAELDLLKRELVDSSNRSPAPTLPLTQP